MQITDGDDEYEQCGSRPLDEEGSTDEFFTAQQMLGILEKGSGQRPILRAPTKSKKYFHCPDPLVPEWPHHFGEYNRESDGYKVKPDGSLIGTKVTYPHLNESRFGDTSWRNGEFCVAYADRNSSDYYDDYDYDGVFRLVFGVCFLPGNEPDNSLEVNFHPWALGISVFFLILTIIIYVWFKGFNLKDMNSRIYVAFILNLTITYFTRYNNYLDFLLQLMFLLV